MVLSKRIKVVSGVVLGIVMLGAFASFYLASFVEKKITKKLAESFVVSIDDTDVNLLGTAISLQNVDLKSKDRLKDSMHIQVNEVSINFAGLFNVLSKDTLKITDINVLYPTVAVYQTKNDSTKSERSDNALSRGFSIDDVSIANGSVSLFSADNKLKTASKNFNIHITEIINTDNSGSFGLPIAYNLRAARFSQIFQEVSTTEELYVKDIQLTNKVITVSGLHMKPKYSQKEYIKHIDYQDDWIDLTTDSITINNYKLDNYDNKSSFLSSNIAIIGANLHLYRDKVLPRKFDFKPLYSKMLRDLSIAIQIDTIKATKSSIVYEEKLPDSPDAGKLDFTQMELQITDVNNVDTSKKTKITIDCQFIKNAPLHIDWMFAIHDPNDKFTISGNLGTVSFNRLNKFIEPNMGVNVAGNVDKLFFNFYGNNYKAGGELSMLFNDLKVNILDKENRKKKKKLFSAIVNLFVKSDKDKAEPKQIEVDRVQYKSFFNYFWLCVKDGVQQSIL